MKKFILTAIIFLSLNLYSNSVSAQDSKTGNWFIYVGNQAINPSWNWHNEIQYRNYNFAGDLQQLLLRTGIGYNITENNNNLLLGYAFINSKSYLPNTDEKVGNNEHRVYQQFITRQNFGRVYVQHRYRTEERFLQDDFQMRFRYFLALNIPVNNKTLVKNTVYASVYNEIFINAQTPAFDRNRLYGAVGFVINKSLRAEAGYMAQTLENAGRNQFQIVFFNNLPLHNSKD